MQYKKASGSSARCKLLLPLYSCQPPLYLFPVISFLLSHLPLSYLLSIPIPSFPSLHLLLSSSYPFLSVLYPHSSLPVPFFPVPLFPFPSSSLPFPSRPVPYIPFPSLFSFLPFPASSSLSNHLLSLPLERRFVSSCLSKSAYSLALFFLTEFHA